MKYYLGIDTGATKTHALIADETGRVHGFGRAGSGNHEVVGYDGVSKAVMQAWTEASAAAGIGAAQIRGAGFGIAGYDFPSEKQETLHALSVLGLNCPQELVNDVSLGISAGTTHGWGISADAGSGNNVRGRDARGREGWVTGCGSAFGEHGGSGEIVARAIQMISWDWSKRGEPTSLSNAFIKALGSSDLTDMITSLALGEKYPSAAHAQLVFKEAARGDPVAIEVIRWSAHELGQTVIAVARQLDLTAIPFEVVQIGSVFRNGDIYTRPFHESVRLGAPLADFVNLSAPPAIGAVILGMQTAGLDTHPVRPVLFAANLPFA